MAKQKETSLQERVQTLVKKRGGYIQKNHGSMISEPGVPDLFCCYKGYFIAIETKVGYNKPTEQQGIQCRNIQKANGYTIIVKEIEDIEKLLNFIDEWENKFFDSIDYLDKYNELLKLNLDDGTRY